MKTFTKFILNRLRQHGYKPSSDSHCSISFEHGTATIKDSSIIQPNSSLAGSPTSPVPDSANCLTAEQQELVQPVQMSKTAFHALERSVQQHLQTRDAETTPRSQPDHQAQHQF